MRVKLQLVLCSDDGREETVTDLVTLKKDAQRIEQLGLTLKEAKQLLTTIQKRLLHHQVDAFLGLDHGVGHPVLSVLCYSSSWRTEGRWWYVDRGQDRGKHRSRLLPEKPLRRRGAVSPCEEKVVHSRQALTLSRVIEA